MITEMRGSSIVTEISIQDEDMNYVNPSSISISISDPDGNFVITSVNMTQATDTGFFTHLYQSDSNAIQGAYLIYLIVTQGTYVYAPEPFVGFILE